MTTNQRDSALAYHPDSAPTDAARDAVETASVWPGVADPATLLGAVCDWLAGYNLLSTRLTYAGQALGLPCTGDEIERWGSSPDGGDGWPAAVRRYAQLMRAPDTSRQMGGGPPPAAPGKLRALHWFRWCATRGVDPLRARASHTKAWLADLAAAGAALATRDKMLGAVRALYDHLAAEDLAEANPAALNRKRLGLTQRRASTSRTITLADAEVAALYYFASRLPRQRQLDKLRARAVVAIFTAGVRVSELCDLNRVDLHFNRGRRALRVHGKGGKERIVYLAAPVATAIDDYLRDLDVATGNTAVVGRGRQGGTNSPLLVNREGRRCTRQAIYELLRRIAAAIDPEGTGIAATVHPHALRHYYVTTAIEEGSDVTDVAIDVGHASVDTTRHVYSSAAPDPKRSSSDAIARRVFGNLEPSPPGTAAATQSEERSF